MSKRIDNLTLDDKELIIKVYKESKSREEAQSKLADYFEVTPRAIRKWAKRLGVGVMAKNIINPSRVMIYDIETARVPAKLFWSGKQFVSYKQLRDVPKIISVAWKWFGDEKVHHLEWDSNHCDKQLMVSFLEEYNNADLIIGYNNNNFDNRFINARAAFHGLYADPFVKSLDLMKQAKKFFRVPSYSLAYMCKYFGVTQKISHEGIVMWDMIEDGTPEEQEEYLAKMIEYNVGDIISTEEVYIQMIPFLRHQTHLGVLKGAPKFSCPVCGRTDTIEFVKRMSTAAGTIQVVMRCTDDGATFKITNKQYMDYLDTKIQDNG